MEKNFKVVVGCDHAAPDMKNEVVAYLRNKGYEVTDVGVHSTASCDYPVIAHELCTKIQDGSHKLGILICGTGIGMSMAANKHHGIRAACCSEPYSAQLTRLHNDANVLCFGARVVGLGTAFTIVDTFLETEFEGGRHQRRVDLVNQIENDEAER
jgi:ribose 5-phosphate isomerase B